MQKIEDLKEIFTAVHDVGAAWQNELVALHAENKRLAAENENLRGNYKTLVDENKNLRAQINNLSEKVEQLNTDLRNEIINELNVTEREEFYKFVRDYLREIRKSIGGVTATEPPTNEPIEPENLEVEEIVEAPEPPIDEGNGIDVGHRDIYKD